MNRGQAEPWSLKSTHTAHMCGGPNSILRSGGGAHLRGALATEDLATCPAVVLPRESGKGDPAPGTSKYFYHNSINTD